MTYDIEKAKDVFSNCLLDLPRLNESNLCLRLSIEDGISQEDKGKIENLEEGRYYVIFTSSVTGKLSYFINFPKERIVEDIERVNEEYGAGIVKIWRKGAGEKNSW